MKIIKIILIVIGIAFIAIQFIRPDRNISEQPSAADISTMVIIPDNVRDILKNSCFDCHSNNTDYPWYSHVQPAGWYLAKHIRHGKGGFNFNEFAGYEKDTQLEIFGGIAYVIENDFMPLKSYLLLHKDARLDANKKQILIDWANSSKELLSADQ
jgi:hypothetical protein